ncbi:MAG: hypothetical protein JO083_11035 [Candidatus Eremiobacteraeota bacterium]|nr:hypothetical protein [Candidatus Eremiobacteraeota bacterium]
MRLGFAALAVALIVAVLVVRLRALAARRTSSHTDHVYDRAERIRRERDARGRPR